jgi:hypothetical protein
LPKLGLPNLSGMINLTFSYLGGPSDVIMANGGIDQTRNYVFEINMQTVGRSQAKELKAWDVSDDFKKQLEKCERDYGLK